MNANTRPIWQTARGSGESQTHLGHTLKSLLGWLSSSFISFRFYTLDFSLEALLFLLLWQEAKDTYQLHHITPHSHNGDLQCPLLCRSVAF